MDGARPVRSPRGTTLTARLVAASGAAVPNVRLDLDLAARAAGDHAAAGLFDLPRDALRDAVGDRVRNLLLDAVRHLAGADYQPAAQGPPS